MMNITFGKLTDLPHGTLYEMLKDAYSFDGRFAEAWSTQWQEFDNFFSNESAIARKCGFVTLLSGEPVGFVSWDPRGLPEAVRIGHNCVLSRYKGQGIGTLQMQEAVQRISRQDYPRRIIVTTSDLLIPAQKMYQRAGFRLTSRRKNEHFSGDFLDFEIAFPEGLLSIEQTLECRAHEVMRQYGIREAWESIGAEVNPVGSLSMGLLMNHRDIDLHIYTKELDLAESLKAIARICGNPAAAHLEFHNAAETEEACFEWHLRCPLYGEEWKIDMIQIRKHSKYDGCFEHIAERTAAALTPETKCVILELKNLTPETESIMGIEYYQAVLEGGVRNWPEFAVWRRNHPVRGIHLWCPQGLFRSDRGVSAIPSINKVE